MHHRIPFFLALRPSVRHFQMPLEGLRFVKTLVAFGIIYAADPTIKSSSILEKVNVKPRLRSSTSVDSPSIFLIIT